MAGSCFLFACLIACKPSHDMSREEERVILSIVARDLNAIDALQREHLVGSKVLGSVHTALEYALKLDTYCAIHMLNTGFDPNLASNSGLTPLGYASGNMSTVMVQELISSGADVNGGITGSALWRSVRRIDPEKAEVLMGNGAKFISEEEKQTALDWIRSIDLDSLEAMLEATPVRGAQP